MAVQKKLKHVDGLKELDALLDGLTDPKFRARALRTAAKKTMAPVEDTLKSKLPTDGSDETSYKYYADGYKAGDLARNVITKVTVNTNKKINVGKNGLIKNDRHNELSAKVTFKPKYMKLAGILEHGRTKRNAVTRDGNVFYSYGKRTDQTQRDIGTTTGRNFVTETATESEAQMVSTFKKELLSSIEREYKRLNKPNRKPRKPKNA